jgi:diaminopimelate decarboxylase
MSTRRPYEAPTLTTLPFLAYGKHAARELIAADDPDNEEIRSRDLVRAYGSPLYVVSEQRLRDDYRKFRDSFTRPGLRTQVAYSVKTNYLPAICMILKSEGAWAEVVSTMEYELARSLGFRGDQIIYNGPNKESPILRRAVAEGAIINLDGFDELTKVEAIARASNRRARIGMRMSFRHHGLGWTKFGFDDDNGESQIALNRIAESRWLNLELLHNHCGTFVLLHDLYAESVKRLVELGKRAKSLGLSPTMVDVGGGFPSVNTIKPDFDVPGGSKREGEFWKPYADEICEPILKAKELFGGHPTLILEPGRAVVDGCTILLTTVVAKKGSANGKPAVIVDAGVNLMPTAVFYDHPVSRAAETVDELSQPLGYDVFGPLCMQTDVLRRNVNASHLEVGDIMTLHHVGAYCHSQSMQFIETRPATVLVGPDGHSVIRQRETWRDVFALDHIPKRLRDKDCDF